MMDELKEIAVVVVLGVGALLGFIVALAAVLAFYGAILGGLGAAIYVSFKWLVGLFA